MGVIDDGLSRRQSLGLLASANLSVAGQAPPSAARTRVSVVDFGAQGDGLTDDSAAFQAALDTGRDVFVPGASRFYRLRRTLATRQRGQSLTGEGHASFLVQNGEGSDATVLAVMHDDCTIAGLRLKPGNGGAPLYEGWGVTVSQASRCTVHQCRVEGMRRGGVLVHDSTRCAIRDNRFVDGVVRADGRIRQADMGYDVLVAGSSSFNVVEGNECASGCGTGIGCQTVADGESQAGNVVRANMIRGHPCYGIMAYLSGSRGRIDGIAITDNNIAGITGSVRTDDKSWFYGAGIYVQTANDFLISGNHLHGTNVDRRLPPSGSAVPAAIAVSGRGNGTITGNMIRDCLDGIASIQATGPVAEGEGTAILGNVISECGRIGINLSDCAAATVVGNRLTGSDTAAHGVFVWRTSDAARLSDFTVSGNFVHRFHVGIEVLGTAISRAAVNGNTVTGAVGYAIACGATASVVTGNILRGGTGIALPATARHGRCRDNVVEASGPGIVTDRLSGVGVADNVVVATRQ